jgi:hypothetical protein
MAKTDGLFIGDSWSYGDAYKCKIYSRKAVYFDGLVSEPPKSQ